jgi:predicted nucleic acid-binding protein
MTWVIDASVAVKWFVDEARSAEARAVLASGQSIIAPDLIIAETCNAAWKKVRRGDISQEQGEAMVRALPLSFDRLAPTAPLSERALELARRFDHPTYDCFYVALAESESAVLVTDDDKLIRLGKQARLAKWMKALATFESGSK